MDKLGQKENNTFAHKKALFVANQDSFVELFLLPCMKILKERGYEVHVATDTDKTIPLCDKKIKLTIERSPFKFRDNLKAVRELKNIMAKEGYEIVHCHTPVGGMVARLAAKKFRHEGTRVIYTAHGFHFFDGAPLHFWLMFYPVEKWLAKYTDTLITINDEDYKRASSKFSRRCYDIRYVPGVGVDPDKFSKKMSAEERVKLRNKLGLSKDDKVLIFPAELSKRKNQMWLINTLAPLFKKDKRYHLLLPGKDSLNGECQRLADRLDLEKQIHFLGFRKDIPELLQISNVLVSSAKQEGLPVNLMEAAFLGLPIIATDCRGNRDVCEAVGNSIIRLGDSDSMIKTITKICKGQDWHDVNIDPKLTKFCLKNIDKIMNEIYRLGNCKLSIIIPVYNCKEYIESCLESITRQGFDEKIEIIVVDDGSTDGSEKICDVFAKEHKNVKVFHCKNNGVSSARNFGLQKASGDYVYFVDADDLVLENCIKYVFSALARNVEIVSIDYKKISGEAIYDNFKTGELSISFTDNILDTMYRFSLWQNIISRDLLTKNFLKLNEELKYTEDLDFALEAILRAKKIAVIHNCLYGYRKNDSSVTSTINDRYIEDIFTFINKWSKRICMIDDVNVRKYLGTFLAYQSLIAAGMSSLVGDNSNKSFNYALLKKYHNSKKTKLGYVVYKMFGAKNTTKMMGRFLVSKGMRVEKGMND